MLGEWRGENIVGQVQLLANELLALLCEDVVVVPPGERILHNATGLEGLHYTINVYVGGVAELTVLIDICDARHVPHTPVLLQSQGRVLVQVRIDRLVDCLRNVDHGSGPLFSGGINSL